jgi:hypothetical protein
MKKSSKKFTISSESKNDKGFRVKTSGIDIKGYQQNPIMLMMHQRPTGKSTDEVGVIGNFVDLHFDDNKLFGTPAFDESDVYALKLFSKVENNVMRMCSAGLLPKKWGKDAAGDIWLLESKLIEVSLADIGSNSEAFAVSLCNENGDIITLSLEQIENNFNPNPNMKIIKLSAGAVALGLAATLETEDAVQEAMQTLVELATAKDGIVVQLTADLGTEKTAKENAEAALVTLQSATKTAENKAFVALAHKEGKFVAADIPKYEKLMQEAPETGKEIINTMPANKTVMEQLKNGEDGKNPILKLTYDELDASGKLETLKADFPDAFKEKFKAKWNKEYEGE